MKLKQSDVQILVTGATGHQGSAVVQHLLEHGFGVSALVRDPRQPAALALEQAGAKLVTGDLDDRASLDRALQPVSGAFSVQSLQSGIDAEIRQGKAFADAAHAAGIEHFVYSSVGSADRKTRVPHFDSKFEIEEHVRALRLPYTILRPVNFFYNYESMRPVIEQGTLSLPLSPARTLQQLSEHDYGKMVASVFKHPTDFLNRAIDVASVEMRMTDVAAVFSQVLGRNVTYQQIPFEEFEQQAGREMTIMFRWFQNVGYSVDLVKLRQEFPAPTDLESYLLDKGWAESAYRSTEPQLEGFNGS